MRNVNFMQACRQLAIYGVHFYFEMSVMNRHYKYWNMQDKWIVKEFPNLNVHYENSESVILFIYKLLQGRIVPNTPHSIDLSKN